MIYQVHVLHGAQSIASHVLPLGAPAASEVRIKIVCCAICTLEQRLYAGKITNYPFAGGHEIAGTIDAIGEDVRNLHVGQKVSVRLLTTCGTCHSCRSGHENLCESSFVAKTHEGLSGPGGFAEYLTTDARNVYTFSDATDLGHAALTEPLACCVHSIRKADIQLAETVVVIGAGIMGAFHVRLAKLRGARVITVEKDVSRLETARRMGADILIDASKTNSVDEVKRLTGSRGADVVFCTAAAPQAAENSLSMAGKRGRVILYSSFHPNDPILVNGNRIHSSESVITGSVNPQIQDFYTAASLIDNGLVEMEPLITAQIPAREIDRAFELALKPESYRVLVTYPL